MCQRFWWLFSCALCCQAHHHTLCLMVPLVQVDMTDVLRVKHARHNAQPSARQQQQQQQDPAAGPEAAGLRALGLAAGRVDG